MRVAEVDWLSVLGACLLFSHVHAIALPCKGPLMQDLAPGPGLGSAASRNEDRACGSAAQLGAVQQGRCAMRLEC